MAVEVKVESKSQGERKYPYLAKANSGCIVLLYSERKGFCINGVEYEVGHYSETWMEERCTPLSPSESITLRNV